MSLNDKSNSKDLKSMELTDDELESVAGGSMYYEHNKKINEQINMLNKPMETLKEIIKKEQELQLQLRP